MDANERQIIDQLFGRLREVEGKAAPRDPEAEAFIAERLAAQPGAAYYMAQTIIVQERALEAQAEQAPQREGGGGFLGSLFGGGRDEPRRQQTQPQAQGGPWGQRQGGGFLAGAAQTAVGVAGGVVVGNMLMDAFTTSPAEAAAADNGNDSTETADAGDSGGDSFGDFGDI